MPGNPPEIEAFVTIPLCIVAGTLLLKKKPTGYILAPILLVLISIRTLYVGKIVPFIMEFVADFLSYDVIPEQRKIIFNDVFIPFVKATIVEDIPWFLKFIPSFAALVIAYFFLKSMRDDLPTTEITGSKAAPTTPPRRPARKKT